MLKLNLGCGNKLYPQNEGWINVDVEPPGNMTFHEIDSIDEDILDSINTKHPLVHQSLLQSLQFVDDEVADEIHGYHIIEHFFRDEVPGVLEEWKRVLKPGGTIILEQPDVIKCAANFLAGLVNGDERLGYNLGFLGFYGDGTSEAPYMGHKWGWHAATLGEQLMSVGFVNVRQEPAETHMKDVRDFRIVGEKE